MVKHFAFWNKPSYFKIYW